MAKSKLQKQEILRDLTAKINDSKSVVFTKFNGLGVKDNELLRRELKANDSEYYVAKKTLLNIAFNDSKIEGVNVEELEGNIAVIFGYEDEVAPARLVNNFKKDHKGKIEFVGGVLENKFITAAEVTNLALLPSREELYAKLVGSINSPVSGFVNVLAGNLRNFVQVIKAIEEKKQ